MAAVDCFDLLQDTYVDNFFSVFSIDIRDKTPQKLLKFDKEFQSYVIFLKIYESPKVCLN
jgi:hypothetical protein